MKPDVISLQTVSLRQKHESMLSHFDFVHQLSSDSATMLNREMRHYTKTGKQILIHKGDVVGGVYLIEEGGLRVYTISTQGRESTLYTIHPGESCILAMNCVFSDILYPAWVENDRPLTRIAVIPAPVYRRLHETERAVQQFTMDVLSARIFDLMSTLEEVSTLPLDRRIASFLLKHSNSTYHIVMSHEKMASHLGTAREVVTRNLKQLENLGLIEVERGYSKILSIEKLRQFIEEQN